MTERDDELPGRRTAIVAAHWTTIGASVVVLAAALVSTVVSGGPRGSRPLGLALAMVAATTVWAGWTSLESFRATDRPRLLWMGVVGVAWTAVTVAAASL